MMNLGILDISSETEKAEANTTYSLELLRYVEMLYPQFVTWVSVYRAQIAFIPLIISSLVMLTATTTTIRTSKFLEMFHCDSNSTHFRDDIESFRAEWDSKV